MHFKDLHKYKSSLYMNAGKVCGKKKMCLSKYYSEISKTIVLFQFILAAIGNLVRNQTFLVSESISMAVLIHDIEKSKGVFKIQFACELLKKKRQLTRVRSLEKHASMSLLA